MPILPDEQPNQEYLDWCLNDRLRFLQDWIVPESYRVLDIGPANRLSQELRSRMRLHITNTTGDLDGIEWLREFPAYCFQDVLCLEVLEHLANPLQFLIALRYVMAPGARLWLTTPKAFLRCFQQSDHFIEYDRRRLLAILERAGFKVEEVGLTKSGYPLHTFWHGVRPCIRALFRWNYYIKAINPKEKP